MLKKLRFSFNANRLIADRLEILERKIRDLELWVYGTDATFDEDGRIVATGGNPPITVARDERGNWSSVVYPVGTVNFSWTEDEHGNRKVSSYTELPSSSLL